MENIVKLPSLGFKEAVKKGLKNLTNFNGRARRSELWWFLLACLIAYFVVSIFVSDPVLGSVVSFLFTLIMVAVTIRRLHDRNHSGLWVFASVAINVYVTVYNHAKGYIEALNTINPSPKVLEEMSSDLNIMIPSLLAFVINITIFVFTVLDSSHENNKYGDSPKYVIKEE